MTVVLACAHHPDRPAVFHDSYVDEVVCREHFFNGVDSAYECEFVLNYVPPDFPARWPNWPTVEVAP